ncbi:MAG: hypothetical protein ABI791_07180 [Acidobacteriota bacterium]
MGFWDEVFKPLPSYKNFHKSKEELIADLERASSYLGAAEMVIDDAERISVYRDKIDQTIQVLELPETTYKNIVSGIKIANAISDLGKINISQNPQAAAKAFGRLFSGIGELARYLPPPINGYFEIFAEAEHFFEDMRVKLDPRIHMREPGAQEVVDNL